MASKGLQKPLKVLFIHPDLGIGGAERLVVDAAVGLQELGHKVSIWTSHCDPSHCFDEARDGTLSVHVPPKIIPRTLFSRFAIVFAILRQIQLVLTLYFRNHLSRANAPDIIFADQLSACLPLLRILAPYTSILFYVHFPDLLLAPHTTPLQKLYRAPFDTLEEFSTGTADGLAVNSLFTRTVFNTSFPRLSSREPSVIYPCISDQAASSSPLSSSPLWNNQFALLLSLNRFEPKKNLALAVRSYASLPSSLRSKTRLLIAGGYDPRISYNVATHRSLQELCASLSLPHHTAHTIPTALSCPSNVAVLFLPSITAPLKELLLRQSRLLLYTPPNEHFGIVPLEAMNAGTAVLAANTGGPLETVQDPQHTKGKADSRTGWLRDVEDLDGWTKVLTEVLGMKDEEMRIIGERGRKSVATRFSRDAMARRIEEVMTGLVKQRLEGKRKPVTLEGLPVMEALGVALVFVAALIKTVWFS